MKKLFCALVVIGLAFNSFGAWNSPAAKDIKVNTNAFSSLAGSDLQSVLNFMDDNVLLSSSGYITTSYLQSLNYLASTNNNTWSGTNTFTGNVIVSGIQVSGDTNIDLTYFNGFKIALAVGDVVTGDTSFVTCTRLTNELYDTEGIVSAGRISPTNAGFYEVTVAGLSVTVESHVRLGVSSNSYEIPVTLRTGDIYSSGTALLYVPAKTNYITIDVASASGTSTITNMTVFGRYVGR